MNEARRPCLRGSPGLRLARVGAVFRVRERGMWGPRRNLEYETSAKRRAEILGLVSARSTSVFARRNNDGPGENTHGAQL